MLNSLKYWLLHSNYIQNNDGVKKFADNRINKIVKKVSLKKEKISTKLDSKKEKLSQLSSEKEELEEKSNLLLDVDDFHSVRMNYRVALTSLILIAICEMFLNFFSFKIVIPGYGLLWDSMRLVSALLLTGLSIVLAELFFVEIMPVNKIGKKKEKNRSNKPLATLVLLVLIFFLYVIYAMSSARAQDIEGQSSGIVYWGLICLSIILPIGGGLIWRRLLKYKDAYSNTKKLNRLKKKIDNINQTIVKIKGKSKSIFKKCLNKYWADFDNFKTLKSNYDEDLNIKQDLPADHYSNNRESFEEEVEKRLNDRL